ncbi:hypothetical protein KEF29_05235 [Streptomyces tuirus]|uniref:PH domain-containing protein n=1 Tax=Streptomyces tuirus TaxID=68278 RepID=A0A941J1Z9_9ACTN|nr:hypothetical protein [Streptomyces tuirus]
MQTRVLRRPVYVWFPVAAAISSYVCSVLIAGPWDEEPAAAFAVAGASIFFWALGWDSAIRSTDNHVSFTNFLVTATVAWTDVDEVDVHDGLTITLRDGREMGSVAFGSSLLGSFTGYRTHQRAFHLLREAQLKASGTQGGNSKGQVRRHWSFEWRRLLCALTVAHGPLAVILVLSR